MQFTIQMGNRKDSGKCIVRCVSFNNDLGVQDPMGKDWSCSESLLSVSKAERHSSVKCQGVPLWVRHVSGTVIQE